MGNQHLHGVYGSPDYNPHLTDWENISGGHGAPLWRHRSTGEELEQYKYMAQSSNDLRRLRNLFEFRHNSSVLVATRFFMDMPKLELCGNHHLVSMFAERMHLRLSQINDVPYPDVLHLYSNILHGYHELFRKIGYFPINETMIGISREGKVKVWLHSDLSHDRPDKDASSFTKSQHDMVVQIIQIIDRNTDHSTSPENIAKFLLEQPIQTFLDAITRLNMWPQKHFVGIPDRLNTIANLIRSGHFGRISPSRRTDSTHNANNNSRLHHLHGLLTAEQKSHLPPGSKIITTEVQEIKSTVAAGASINAPIQVSAVPIFGQTPVGLRPLSPARIVIRAHSPIGGGRSALFIRPHSPPPGQYTQLHPLLARSNLPFSSNFMHPRDAATVAPISPLVRNAQSTFTYRGPTTPINNEQLLALQKRIQGELERVNALVNASQTTATFNIADGSQRVSSQPKTTTATVTRTETPIIPSTRWSVERQTKPSPTLISNNNVKNATNLLSTSPIGTVSTTTVQPTYKAELFAQVAATPSLSSNTGQYVSASQTSNYQPTGTTNVTSYGSSQNYNANTTPTMTATYQPTSVSPTKWEKIPFESKTTQKVVERSPLSSTPEGPKIINDGQKHVIKSNNDLSLSNNHTITTHTNGLVSVDNGSHTNFNNQPNHTTQISHTGVPIATTSKAITTTTMTTTTTPYNTNTIYSQFKAATVQMTEGISTTDPYLIRKIDIVPIMGTQNFNDNQTGINHEYSSTGSYQVDESDAIYKEFIKNIESSESTSVIKRSFDKNTNIIRISARNATKESGVRVLYEG